MSEWVSVYHSYVFIMKQPFVTAVPHLYEIELQPEDTHIVLACDGVWDELADEMAVECVVCNSCAYTYVRTHTYTHARTHTYTHIHIHTPPLCHSFFIVYREYKMEILLETHSCTNRSC